MQSRFLRDHFGLLCLAGIAVCWVVARACIQSVTLDEADSFLLFGWKTWPAQFYPSSGNHVLNSILERLVASVLGVSNLTLRTPAIAGAILYIVSALHLCLLLTNRKLLQLPLFVSLVCNPLVFDYLVAARGYSLAIGFLLAAIATIATMVLCKDPDVEVSLRRKCAWASVCLALSFSANFSFAIVNATTMLLFFLLLTVRQQREAGFRRYTRLAIPCFLPGIVVAFLICGPTVWNFPKDQLYFGSESLGEMWEGLMDASFDKLNPELMNPLLISLLGKLQGALPYVTAVAVVVLLASVELGRWRARSRNQDVLLTLTRLLAGIALITLQVHWIAFHTLHVLLPKDRTGLFFVPLLTLAFGGALALRFQSKKRDVLRAGGVSVLILIAVYFTGCLRLSYFKQWSFNSDSKQLYWVIDGLNRRCGITEYFTEWRYPGVLNFYRVAYGNRSLEEFTGGDTIHPLPTDRRAYVLYYPDYVDFIQQQRLQIVYHNEETSTAVMIHGCEINARPN